jgi:PAS domain-containing protein
MHAVDFTAPESREAVLRHVSTDSPEPYEAVSLRKDGTTFDTEIRGKRSVYQGRAVRITALRDITASKRVERRLREAEHRYRAGREGSRCRIPAGDRGPGFRDVHEPPDRGPHGLPPGRLQEPGPQVAHGAPRRPREDAIRGRAPGPARSSGRSTAYSIATGTRSGCATSRSWSRMR